MAPQAREGQDGRSIAWQGGMSARTGRTLPPRPPAASVSPPAPPRKEEPPAPARAKAPADPDLRVLQNPDEDIHSKQAAAARRAQRMAENPVEEQHSPPPDEAEERSVAFETSRGMSEQEARDLYRKYGRGPGSCAESNAYLEARRERPSATTFSGLPPARPSAEDQARWNRVPKRYHDFWDRRNYSQADKVLEAKYIREEELLPEEGGK